MGDTGGVSGLGTPPRGAPSESARKYLNLKKLEDTFGTAIIAEAI